MKAEAVIHNRLTTFAGVTALILQRTYPVALPQDSIYPCIVYRRVESNRVRGVYQDPGYAYSKIQVTAFAKTFDDLKDLAEQVRLALERFGSALTGTTIAGVLVYDIVMGSEADSYEPALDVYAHSIDFEVLHAE
ncbi:MAG: DUF3168 domain-containing protein [Sulfuricaulis sp.]|nr:DUF3168 domain-containing protein [Sulfuricaulis sp.]